MAKVKESFIVKVTMPHISSFYIFDHSLSIMSYITSKIIFWLSLLLSDIKLSNYTIFLIIKSYLAMHHVMACAYQSIPKSVLLVVKNNFGPVSKLTSFLPADFKVNRIQIGFDCKIAIAVKSVNSVWAFQQ